MSSSLKWWSSSGPTQTGAAVNSLWPVGLQRKGRVATWFNDNSSDDSSDNPPAFLADCREPALCSPLPLLAWWRFILIWMDHQLDNGRIAHSRACARRLVWKRNRAWWGICAHDGMQTHACMYTQCVLSDKEAIIEKDLQVGVATLLGCRCYYLLGTCSRRESPHCLPQLRLETLRRQTKNSYITGCREQKHRIGLDRCWTKIAFSTF